MTEVKDLDVKTLEYVVSMLDADIKTYKDFFHKTDSQVKRNKYKATGNYIVFLRNEIKTLIEEQREA